MIQEITERKIPILNKTFDNIFIVYNQAGLKIQRIYVFPEFKQMADTFKEIDITMNYAIAQGHVTETERIIRTIKEMFRTLYHRIPCNNIPKVMVQYGAKYVVKRINMFPPKDGVSKIYSPRAI